MHPRLTELLDYLDAQRASMLDAAGALPPERWGVRPSPDRWSVAEVCWHLQRVERGVAKVIAKRTAEARAAGHPDEAENGSVLGALDGRGVADRSVPIEAPSFISPPEIPDAAFVQRELDQSRAALRAAVTQADGLALGSITHPHPALGEIDLYQWILFVGQHEARHTAQINEAAAAATAVAVNF